MPRFLSCLTNGLPSHHLCVLLADAFNWLETMLVGFLFLHPYLLPRSHLYTFITNHLHFRIYNYSPSDMHTPFLKVVPVYSSKKKKTYLASSAEMPQLRPRVVKTCRYRRYIIDSGGEVRAPSRFFGPSAVFRTSLNHRNIAYTADNDRVFDPPVTLMKMSYAYCPVLEDGGVRWRGFRFGSATEQVRNAG